MSFKIFHKNLVVNCQMIAFPDQVMEVLEYDDFYVVMTDYHQSSTNENVYGIDPNGFILWQISPFKSSIRNKEIEDLFFNPYTSIEKLNSQHVKLIDFNNRSIIIEAYSGCLSDDK